LTLAVRRGDLDKIKELIRTSPALINQANDEGTSPLLVAAAAVSVLFLFFVECFFPSLSVNKLEAL
jgi:ankyrin repeat protein